MSVHLHIVCELLFVGQQLLKWRWCETVVIFERCNMYVESVFNMLLTRQFKTTIIILIKLYVGE